MLSRAKSCTECIRVDKDCSFCTDEVRPCRGARGSASHPADGGIPPPLVKAGRGTREQGQLLAPASLCKELSWMGSAETWVSFGADKWGGRGVRGKLAGIQEFMRKCQCARPETVCARDGGGESYPRQPSNSLVVTFPWCWGTLALLCETRPHLSALLRLPEACYWPQQRTLLPDKCLFPLARRICCFLWS